MTHVTRQQRLEGELQLKLVEAWEVLSEVCVKAQGSLFGDTKLRREWRKKVAALRGCVMLAAAGLLDLRELEYGGSPAELPADLVGEVLAAKRQYRLLCPHGLPDMSQGLGPVAAAVRKREAEIVPFLVGAAQTRYRDTRAASRRRRERLKREQVQQALGKQDAMLEEAGRQMRIRAGVEEGQ